MSGTVRLVPTGKDSSGRESILYLLRSAFRQAKRPLSGSGILPSRPRTIRFILCRRGKSRQTMRTGKRSSRRTPPPLGTAAPLRPFDSRKSGTPLSGRFPEHVPLIDSSQHDSVENGLAPADRKIDTDALPFFRAYVVADRHGPVDSVARSQIDILGQRPAIDDDIEATVGLRGAVELGKQQCQPVVAVRHVETIGLYAPQLGSGTADRAPYP